MAIVVIGIVRCRSLFSVVVLMGVYSFLMASVMMILDAVDVAMTEASVGAGISTVLLLATLYLTKVEEAPPRYSQAIPLVVALGAGVVLIYGTYGLPEFGAALTPVNTDVGASFLHRSLPETGIPNVVTSVLASYRGFDTLGETAVIFTAGIAVLVLLKHFREAS